MTTVRKRAARVAEMPHVERWVEAFKKLSKEMPDEVMVFVAAGTPCVLALNEEGFDFRAGTGQDQRAKVASIPGGRWDGGDW